MAFTTGLSDAAQNNYSTTQTLGQLIGMLISAVLGILGVILLVLVVYAGFLWMTAAGDDKKIKKAKDILASAVVGLIIVVASYSISTFVIGALQGTANGASNISNQNSVNQQQP